MFLFVTHFRLLQLHLTTECRCEVPSLLLRNLKGYFHIWAESYFGLSANQLVSVRVTAATAATTAGRMTISYLQVEVPAVRCGRPIFLLL
jgi:hypothetical protein